MFEISLSIRQELMLPLHILPEVTHRILPMQTGFTLKVTQIFPYTQMGSAVGAVMRPQPQLRQGAVLRSPVPHTASAGSSNSSWDKGQSCDPQSPTLPGQAPQTPAGTRGSAVTPSSPCFEGSSSNSADTTYSSTASAQPWEITQHPHKPWTAPSSQIIF